MPQVRREPVEDAPTMLVATTAPSSSTVQFWLWRDLGVALELVERKLVAKSGPMAALRDHPVLHVALLGAKTVATSMDACTLRAVNIP